VPGAGGHGHDALCLRAGNWLRTLRGRVSTQRLGTERFDVATATMRGYLR
jgi:hypothetical protein